MLPSFRKTVNENFGGILKGAQVFTGAATQISSKYHCLSLFDPGSVIGREKQPNRSELPNR
jgi:hypothetical protein